MLGTSSFELVGIISFFLLLVSNTSGRTTAPTPTAVVVGDAAGGGVAVDGGGEIVGHDDGDGPAPGTRQYGRLADVTGVA